MTRWVLDPCPVLTITARQFERALAEARLPERPDYEAANRFLIKARRDDCGPQSALNLPKLLAKCVRDD